LSTAYVYDLVPPDFEYGIWFAARAGVLAHGSSHILQDHLMEYLREPYVNYHGDEEGFQEILQQAAESVIPPDGFKVSRRQTPKIIPLPATSSPPYVIDQACPWGLP
jgi:hypothetical protein